MTRMNLKERKERVRKETGSSVSNHHALQIDWRMTLCNCERPGVVHRGREDRKVASLR